MTRKRARDWGLTIGRLPAGHEIKSPTCPAVGHCTVDTPEHKTGVTILLPCPENPFVHKLPAAECAEEAVLNSLLTAHTTVGWQGNTVTALTDLWTPEERR